MNLNTKMARSGLQSRRAVIPQTHIRNDLDMEANSTQTAAGAMQSITVEQHHDLRAALSVTIDALMSVLDLIDADPDLEGNGDLEPDEDTELNGDEGDHGGGEDEWGC